MLSLFSLLARWNGWLSAVLALWGGYELTRVGEAEAGIAGCAFGEYGGEDAGPFV